MRSVAQALVARRAARRGVSVAVHFDVWEALYGLCGYDDERMLRGFTRPAARIIADLQEVGLLPARVTLSGS
jgi:hypothetical protein